MPSKTTRPLSKIKATNDARHLMRFLKAKSGTDPADIAKSEKVSIQAVKDSIKKYEAYTSFNSDGQMQLAVRDLIISTIPQAKQTIQGLLTSTTVVRRKNKKTGLEEDVVVDDKTTQLEAMRVVTGLITTTQPKGPAVAVNVQQNNQTAVLSSAETTEERMRRLKAQAAQHNLLPPVVTGVPVSIDAGIDPDDSDDEDDD